MNLRHKLVLIATLFGLSLTANIGFCVRCVNDYYQPLVAVFGASPAVSDWNGAGMAVSVPSWPSVFSVEGPRSMIGLSSVFILLANALVGLGLLLAILYLSRRWFLRPLTCFREAAKQIGAGNWAFRVNLPSNDEFHLLGREINNMASRIAGMQEESANHERIEVGSEATRCVMHNIRGPLTSIRWLAEANLTDPGQDAQREEFDHGIVAAVDRVLDGLHNARDIYRSVPTATTRVRLRSLVDRAVSAVAAAGLERLFQFESKISPSNMEVSVSPHHFGAVLDMLVLHAAATAGGRRPVTLLAAPAASESDYWELRIAPISNEPCGREGGRHQHESAHEPLGREGMMLLRRVMDMHKGRIESVNTFGKAHELILTIPGLCTRERPDG